MKKLPLPSPEEWAENIKIVNANLTPKDVKVITETLGGQTIPPNERLVEAGARYLEKLGCIA